jgi:hypothetical protein
MASMKKGKEIEDSGSGARSNQQPAIIGSNSRIPSKEIGINL